MDRNVLGIDISKAYFHVSLLIETRRPRLGKFANDSVGFQALLQWLQAQGVSELHACLEATGRYGDALARFLYEKDYVISVVNPAQVKSFANSELRRTKTDRVDASLIARFCRAMNPRPWQPPAAEYMELQELTRRLKALGAMRAQEMNRAQALGTSEVVQRSISASIAFLDAQIAEIESEIDKLEGEHPDIKEQSELLQTIPGIGKKSAQSILGEVGDVRRYPGARQLEAQAGLVPSERASGTSVLGRTKLSKTGNARLRKAMYFPAVVALTHNPLIRDFAQRQVALGKTKMVIIGAAMRRLLRLAYGVLKSRQPFDPHFCPIRA